MYCCCCRHECITTLCSAASELTIEGGDFKRRPWRSPYYYLSSSHALARMATQRLRECVEGEGGPVD